MKMNFFKLLIIILFFASCTTKYTRKKTITRGKTPTQIIKKEEKKAPVEVEEVVTESTPTAIEEADELVATSAVKVTPEVIRRYIQTYKDIAMVEMQRYKIPASITLAQGILESGSGQGRLARHARNHFGIKCHLGWEGATISHDDDEKGECFRKYARAEDSFEDHSLFLVNRPRYASLFELKPDDYKGWAHGLKKAGYATDPGYPNKLIFLIKKYNLHQYDLMVLGVVKKEEVKADNPEDFYIVEQGDTLYGISRKTKVSVEKLIELNNLSDSNAIQAGQELRIR